MRPRRPLARMGSRAHACLAVALATVLAPTSTAQQSTPFRATTDVVNVPVSVRSGNTIIRGLTAADFIVTDNGVEQRIEQVDTETVPIDLTMVIDTSGSAARLVDRFKRDIEEVGRLLRPGDRLRVLAIDTYVIEFMPMRETLGALTIARPEASGLSSIHDTLATALLAPVPAGRRHLILAVSDGVDTISALPARAVADLAARSEAVLTIVRVDTEAALMTQWLFACGKQGRCDRAARYWIPYQDRDDTMLTEAARVTGGDWREEGGLLQRRVADLFAPVIEAFRQSYILRFTPRGVSGEGVHRLNVRLRTPAQAALRFRRSYVIPRTGEVTPRPTSVTGGPPATLPALIEAYGRDAFDSVATGLGQIAASDLDALVADFRRTGNPWPHTPRREAAFLIELAETVVFAGTRAREQALEEMSRYQRLVRHPLEPDAFERIWYWAQIAVAHETIASNWGLAAADNALQRFPGEPRFLLARAVSLDQRWLFGTHLSPADGMGPAWPSESSVRETLVAYDLAAEEPATQAEARIRKAWLLLRLGRHGDALAALDIADLPDKELLYLHRLFRGKAQEARGDLEAAERSFVEALDAWPGAQSARVALVTLAVRRGQREQAQAMVERIETQPRDSFDPFWQYWLGDGRFYPAIRALLRREIR